MPFNKGLSTSIKVNTQAAPYSKCRMAGRGTLHIWS